MFKSQQKENAILAISVAAIFVISGCVFSSGTGTEAQDASVEAKQATDNVVVSTIP